MSSFIKVLVPPRLVNNDGFDPELIREIALLKIKEIKKDVRKIEREALIGEESAYRDLDGYGEYSVPWLESIVYLYGLESKRDTSRIWLRYWMKLGCVVKTRVSKNGLTDEDIEKARSYPIEELITTQCRQAGSGKLKTLCCFHEEKTPSFIIYTNENHAHCFGCGKHITNAVDFLMERDGLSFADVVRRLV